MTQRESFRLLMQQHIRAPFYRRALDLAQSDPAVDPQDRTAARREYARFFRTYSASCRRAAMLIDRLEHPSQHRVLTLRYVMGLPWKEVADHTGYSLSHVMRLHRDGMNALLGKS